MRSTLLLLALAACEGNPVHELPGVALAPKLRSSLPAAACGTEIAFAEGGPIAMRYRYLYDAFGRLAFARGEYVESRYEDTIEYRWDNLDQMSSIIQRSSWDGSVAEVEALYSTLGDLVEYTYRAGGNVEHHSYGERDARGLPAVEAIEVGAGKLGSESATFSLHYDAGARLVLATSDDGPTTVYTYDDDARTITIDTNDGAFRGVIEHDDNSRQLSERWSGTDPSATESEQIFAWAGDRLERMTYREPGIVQIETYLYDCDTGR